MKKIFSAVIAVVIFLSGINGNLWTSSNSTVSAKGDVFYPDIEEWFSWLPMDTYNRKTYKDMLNTDLARIIHELFIPFDVGALSGNEYNSIRRKYSLSDHSKIFRLNEVQQTFNTVYGTDINMTELDGLTLYGMEFINIYDNYFIVTLGPHGNESHPELLAGYIFDTGSEYWRWHYKDYWSDPVDIHTVISYKEVAGYKIMAIEYIDYELPSDKQWYKFHGGITVTLNGTEIEFDQPPIIKDDRTLVPMRAIFEAMGCEVIWDDGTIDVWRYGKNIMTLWIDDPEMWLPGGNITLDVPPQIVNDRTLVPVRAISESMGAKVEWDGDTRTVEIFTSIVNLSSWGSEIETD